MVRDPELRFTPNGTAVCVFSLATSRKFTTNGQEREETLFLDMEAWAKTAELIAKYLVKGSQCLIEGHLKQDTWEDKTTQQKRSKIKCVVEAVKFLGAPRSREGPPPVGGTAAPIHDKPLTPGGTEYPTGSFKSLPKPSAKPVGPIEEEDVPF